MTKQTTGKRNNSTKYGIKRRFTKESKASKTPKTTRKIGFRKQGGGSSVKVTLQHSPTTEIPLRKRNDKAHSRGIKHLNNRPNLKTKVLHFPSLKSQEKEQPKMFSKHAPWH
jgi:hypothetical protein